MDKIVLKDDLLLAKGGERFCFIHPEDKLKIIKTLKPELKIHNQQNELEYIYYEYLYSNHKIEDLLNIAQCFGWVDTNYGKGLMFQRILDYDGEQSKHLRYYLRNNLLSMFPRSPACPHVDGSRRFFPHYPLSSARMLFSFAEKYEAGCPCFSSRNYSEPHAQNRSFGTSPLRMQAFIKT